ncbi:unnamed protein product [Sphagnum compactum]
MEATVDVLMQGAAATVMQHHQQQQNNPGLGGGLGLGLEWAACAAVVATTLVVALVSVKRRDPSSTGIHKSGRGQVRLQLKSISSSSSGNCVVTTSRLFSAELNLSDTSSCSNQISIHQEPPADNNNKGEIAVAAAAAVISSEWLPADCISASGPCVLNTEMVFKFEKTTTAATTTSLLPKHSVFCNVASADEGLLKAASRECRPFLGCSRWTLNRAESSLHTEGIQFFLSLEPRIEEIKWNPEMGMEATNASLRRHQDRHQKQLSSFCVQKPVKRARSSSAVKVMLEEWAAHSLSQSSLSLPHHRPDDESCCCCLGLLKPPSAAAHGYWNSLLRLRTRDAMLCSTMRRFNVTSSTPESVELSPILRDLDHIITLKKDVVRIWDAASRKVSVSCHLPKLNNGHGGFGSTSSSFDVHCDSKTAALGSLDGDLSLVDLQTAMCYSRFQGSRSGCGIQSLVFNSWSSSAPNTLITGGPAFDNGLGYSLSLWDTRTNDRQMHANLKSANTEVHSLMMQEHKVFMKNKMLGASALDLRMSGASVVRTIPLEYESLKAIGFHKEHGISSIANGNWWDDDIQQDFLGDDEDEDPDWDFQNQNGSKVAEGSSLLGRCVQAVTRSFSSKPIGR